MESGQDSFLDIVSNIVGILIILVMVAGVRSKGLPKMETVQSLQPQESAVVESATFSTSPEIQGALSKYAEKTRELETVQHNAQNTGQEVEHLQQLLAARSRERGELVALLGMLQTEYDTASEQLSEAEREKIRLLQMIQQADLKMGESGRTVHWLQQNRPQATVLENMPTPKSTLVQDNEAHFQIKGGRVAFVPIDILVERVASEMKNRVGELVKKEELHGIVGPLYGFSMEYSLLVHSGVRMERGIGTRVELGEGILVPNREIMGETVEESVQPQSEFQQRLSSYRQNQYTITFWVYPDSFREYQILKKFLFSRGYRTAARPMNFGDPIGVSSHGTKSATQ